MLIPYGITVKLVSKEEASQQTAFASENMRLYRELLGKNEIENKQYSDEATNEVLMSYARAYSNIALKSKKMNDIETALFFLDKAEKAQKQYYTSYLIAATIYLDNKDTASAIKEYQKVLAVNPSNLISLKNLAVLYFTLNDKQNAMEYAKKYLRNAVTDAERNDAQAILTAVQN